MAVYRTESKVYEDSFHFCLFVIKQTPILTPLLTPRANALMLQLLKNKQKTITKRKTELLKSHAALHYLPADFALLFRFLSIVFLKLMFLEYCDKVLTCRWIFL